MFAIGVWMGYCESRVSGDDRNGNAMERFAVVCMRHVDTSSGAQSTRLARRVGAYTFTS